MRFLISLLLLAGAVAGLHAQPVDSAALREQQMMAFLDSTDRTIAYQTGTVKVGNLATLTIPAGYKYIPDSTARWIVEDLWGNPKDPSVLGMLVKDDYKLSRLGAWAFIVSSDETGHVKDNDADDIDYDDLLKDIQGTEAEANKQRTAEGYPTMHLTGWASKPFYDKENKILHWAKELEFGGSPEHTLNYDVRILGRKGLLSLNAVGTMDQLPDIKAHIPDIIHIARFNAGQRYTDFDPKIDQVAAYTIGGLVAGKLLAKAGLLALLLKNIKLVLLAIFGAFGAGRKKIAAWFSRRKKDDDTAYTLSTPAVPADPEAVAALPEHATAGDDEQPASTTNQQPPQS